MEYERISNVLFTPHQGLGCQQNASKQTMVQRNCGLILFYSKGIICSIDIKSNSGFEDHCCDNVGGLETGISGQSC